MNVLLFLAPIKIYAKMYQDYSDMFTLKIQQQKMSYLCNEWYPYYKAFSLIIVFRLKFEVFKSCNIITFTASRMCPCLFKQHFVALCKNDK